MLERNLGLKWPGMGHQVGDVITGVKGQQEESTGIQEANWSEDDEQMMEGPRAPIYLYVPALCEKDYTKCHDVLKQMDDIVMLLTQEVWAVRLWKRDERLNIMSTKQNEVQEQREYRQSNMRETEQLATKLSTVQGVKVKKSKLLSELYSFTCEEKNHQLNVPRANISINGLKHQTTQRFVTQKWPKRESNRSKSIQLMFSSISDCIIRFTVMHISGYLPRAVQSHALYSGRVTFPNVEENIEALQSELRSLAEYTVINKNMDAEAEFQFVCTFYSRMHSISEILTTTSFEQLLEFEPLREAVGMVIGRLNSSTLSENKNNPIFGAALALALLENGVILPEDPVIAQAVLNRLILSKKGDTPNEFTMPKEYNKSRDGYKTYRQVPNHHYHHLVADSSGNVMDVGEESDIHSTEKDIVWNEPVYKKSSEHDDFKKTVMVKKRSAQNTDESDQESTLLSTGYNIKLPEPPADELWSWRERLSALRFAEVGHLLRRESKIELYKCDTRFGENICHALVICFSSPQLVDALEIQRYRNFESLCDITDNDFNLPLHTAVKNCKPEAVEILGLMSPRAIQVGDGGRQTPLQLAFDTRQTACLQSLLKVATKYDDKGNLCGDILQPMLIRSIKCGYFDVLNILSELNNPQMDWNCTGDDGNTAWYHLLAHPQNDIEETVNILVNCNLDPMNLIVYHKTGASLQSVLSEAFESNESEYVEVRECQQQQKKRYIKRSKLEELKHRPCSATKRNKVASKESDEIAIKPLGSGSQSSENEKDKKVVRLSSARKHQRKQVEKRIQETRANSTTQTESPTCDESDYCDIYTDITELIDVKIEASLLPSHSKTCQVKPSVLHIQAEEHTQESKTDDSEGDIEPDHHEQYTHKQTESKFDCSSDHLWTDVKHRLMHLKLSLMRSMIVKAIDLEHIQVMRDVVLTQPLRHQVYDIHALVISQPIILSTVLKATVQDFVRSNSFIAFKNALSTELHYLFGICRPTVSRIYTSTIEMFKLIVSAMRPVRRSIPSNIKENINTTVTIFNEKAKILTTPSKLWVILRGGDLKKKKKKGMAAQEEKSISLQHATRHSEPLDIPSAALTLVNKSNPLEVVRSHFQVYSKCCTRHDIQNILAIGTEYPASAAFASSSSHSDASTASNYSIHSLKDDTTHRPFNATAKYDRNKQFREHSSLQVMLANRTEPREKPVEPITESHLLPAAREPLASLQPVGRRLEIKGMQNETKFSNEMQTASNVSTRVLLPNTTTEIENSRHRQEPSSMRLAEHGIYVDEQKKDVSKEVLNRSIPTAEQTINDTKRNEPSHHHFNYDREQNDNIKTLAELLHAQDYARIVPLAYDGQPPMSFPPDMRIQYIFITGLAYYKMSNHKKSVQYFQNCLEMAEECHRDGDITICNIYIGDIDFSKRKYTDAAVRYQSALYHYSRDSVAKDFRMILPTKSAVWLKCGSAFKNGSRMGDAVAAYEKAVELASSKKDQLSAHTSLGNLFQGIGENGRAMKEYEAAIELATELKDNISLGWNHGNLGNALLGLHQRDKALYHLFKALDMAVVHEMTPQAIGRAYNNLGTAFQSLNELSKAEEQYDLALAQGIYGNDIAGQARVYGNIGNLQMLSKQYDRAVPHYTEVMRLSQDKATITTAHHNRGCAYYDWAEKKKKAFFVTINSTHEESSAHKALGISNTSSAVALRGSHSNEKLKTLSSSEDTLTTTSLSRPHFKISLHGPDFKRCEEMYRPKFVPEGVQKYYLQGTRDLDYVIRHHEENFSGIKGSPKGLSLSVSLFESNSRTFHRMQDCLVHLQKSDDQPSRFEDALLVAEQSRARTLGELLLKRRGPQLEDQLKSPPSIHQLKSIVARQSCPVVYLSYTGERLLGWILYPTPDNECTINMFEVPLSDTEFDGKSFDYHLRYSLNEQLVEKSFEMYKPFDSQKDKTEPLEKLYDLVARPLMTMLSKLDGHQKDEQGHTETSSVKDDRNPKESRPNAVRKIIIIPDSYTNLLPFTCVLDKETGKFWGDSYYFQIMPSLLTMGILDQLPTVAVSIPVQYQQMLCVVGNPTIPRFKFNNDDWDLGKLPHATKEAEWVSHILKCNPILHEQATKDAVMMRLMNAKVIHLATHGSAASGFLAFAGMNSTKEAIDAKKVLIYPEEIESLNISPALVVLSSCDSGRGVFKADGIQGMARAFILAGAQAVLTALWRVPDESACIFMQFFYQYLVDGLRGTESLHKAIISLRCFSKYSQYIHWSGYQLTGREFQFDVNHSSSRTQLSTKLGPASIFPRLDLLKELEDVFVNSPRLPTDVQVLCGPLGVTPFEPLIDFIHSQHTHFTGGIFWINCRTPQLIDSSLTCIESTLGIENDEGLSIIESSVEQSLVIFDSPGTNVFEDNRLMSLVRNRNIHIVIISKSFVFSDVLRRSINDRLLRGTVTHDIQPLSTIHTTQRIVYSIIKDHHLTPSSDEQHILERLAQFTNGSPDIVNLASSVLQSHFEDDGSLLSFAHCVHLHEFGPLTKPPSVPHSVDYRVPPTPTAGLVRHIEKCLVDSIPTVQESENIWATNSPYDSWQAITHLIDQCKLNTQERVLLNCLSILNRIPIPAILISEISGMICKASHMPFLAPSLHNKLKTANLLKPYPKPILHFSNLTKHDIDVNDLYYVPQIIAEALWKDVMNESDKAMALSIPYKALKNIMGQSPSPLDKCFLIGVCSILLEQFESNFSLVGKECYQELYRSFLNYIDVFTIA